LLAKTFRQYFILCGIIAHLVLAIAFVSLVYAKVGDHWRVKAIERWLQGEIDSSTAFPLHELSPGNYSYLNIPQGKWLKVHQQSQADDVQFVRQMHSGSAWDSKRSRLIIVGSDTHGENWDNSLYYFDLRRLKWLRAYEPDSAESYRVDKSSVAVAGIKAIHPWAMHVFDGVNYSPVDDSLVLSSFPGHLKAKHFKNGGGSLLGRVKKHPTWIYDFETSRWKVWPGKPVHFFPYASAYDTDRNLVVGFLPNGIFEFHNNNEGWKKVGKRSVAAWHTQAVYDDKHQCFVLFGTNSYGNAVHVYRAGDTESQEMPTAGLRPPGASSPPLAFDSEIGKVVALVDTEIDGEKMAQTWLYDTGSDSWSLAVGADFPFKLGMNYHMQYSKRDNLLVLLTSAAPERPSVWVLRL
jgi:hypothetical protein